MISYLRPYSPDPLQQQNQPPRPVDIPRGMATVPELYGDDSSMDGMSTSEGWSLPSSFDSPVLAATHPTTMPPPNAFFQPQAQAAPATAANLSLDSPPPTRRVLECPGAPRKRRTFVEGDHCPPMQGRVLFPAESPQQLRQELATFFAEASAPVNTIGGSRGSATSSTHPQSMGMPTMTGAAGHSSDSDSDMSF
eukprot:GFYU01000883.1.p1 GENE.GFYU01000883.1~~GFYU01000883.1.p1  ORF type:complete len:194 (+),score=16.13 GFYU01000883.1:310-891(+)